MNGCVDEWMDQPSTKILTFGLEDAPSFLVTKPTSGEENNDNYYFLLLFLFC